MPAKLSTTINKIQLVPSIANREAIVAFQAYLMDNDSKSISLILFLSSAIANEHNRIPSFSLLPMSSAGLGQSSITNMLT